MGPSYFDLKKWRVDQLVTCRKASAHLPQPPLSARENCSCTAVSWGTEAEMLRTRAVEVSRWEAVLPEEVLRLPEELARVDASCWDAC